MSRVRILEKAVIISCTSSIAWYL